MDAARVASLPDRIHDAAFEWLQQEGAIAGETQRESIRLPHTILSPTPHLMTVVYAILVAYGAPLRCFDRLHAHVQDWDAEATTPTPPSATEMVAATPDDVTLAHRARGWFEFTRPFLGGDTIVAQLQKYIVTCVTTLKDEKTRYRYPYTTIVQSAGFGKSRLLRELANRTKDDPYATTKVLYTCLLGRSTSSYPMPTPALRDYFFPKVTSFDAAESAEGELASRLYRLYAYALTHWTSVGSDWFSLFDYESTGTLTTDEEICQQLQRHDVRTIRDDPPLENDRILVVAVDEARYLLKTTDGHPDGWFHSLRRALAAALDRIRKRYGQRAGIFAILVDTNSKIANFVPPAAKDKSDGRSELFPPFVLTQTMDIRFDTMVERSRTCVQFYQQLVLTEYMAAWPYLVRMGRPLWDRVKLDDWTTNELPSHVIQLAANKLLGGHSARKDKSFREESAFGVASMLCRAGLRPSSWSPFASRAIADLLAVLVHTNVTHDQFLTTYSSDPILTFGAARVWYQSAEPPDELKTLATHILPQLRHLLRQDVVDTGGVGELVSRIVLLLAMDATGVVVGAARGRQYAGEFRSVCTFLNVLYGIDSPLVLDIFRQPVAKPTKEGVRSMLKQLRGWKIGFSHFVQVTEEPTTNMLWIMLARRAAGIFPRNFKGLDLFIPIFKDGEISMVVVQVKNHAAADPAFPESASMSMRPSLVFTNEFKKEPSNIVRIYMSLRGPHATERQQFYLVDEGVRSSDRIAASKVGASAETPHKESYVLCLEGLGPWNAEREDSAAPANVPVVSRGVAEELQKLLRPWWGVMDLVEEDLARRGDRTGVDEDVVRSVASRPLVGTLLMGWENDEGELDTTVAMEDVADRAAAEAGHARPLSPGMDEEKSGEWITPKKRKRNKTKRK